MPFIQLIRENAVLLTVALCVGAMFLFFLQRNFYSHSAKVLDNGAKALNATVRYSRAWTYSSFFALSIVTAVLAALHTMPTFWIQFLKSAYVYKVAFNVTATLFYTLLYTALANIVNRIMIGFAQYHDKQFSNILVPISQGLKAIIAFLLLNSALSFLALPPHWMQFVHQIDQAMIIGVVGWLVLQCLEAGEAVFIRQHRHEMQSGGAHMRKINTHLVIIKRILMTLVIVMTIASMLMTFERIRSAGQALLTSAGIFATIVGLSARGLLESAFKGIQLAITQPVRLNDMVTIQGDTGVVTEITLHHVVVTLDDRTQIIVPTGDFLEKSFKNWTRSSDDLLGTFVFYLPYQVPIEPIRHKIMEILKASSSWDQKVGHVVVNNLQSNSVELKVVLSAKSSKHLDKLRSEIREEYLEYMRAHHPEALPK